MNTFLNRILRVLKLDSQVFEEVEADQQALPQALGIVILASFATGIAAISKGIDASLIGDMFSALIGWFIWSYIIFFLGTKLLPEAGTEADYGQLLRTIGFASAPGLLTIVGIIPFLFGIVVFITSIWMLVATVIAVRQALDYQSIGRAILVAFLGWIVYVLIRWIFQLIIP
jgi:hypothetical protein